MILGWHGALVACLRFMASPCAAQPRLAHVAATMIGFGHARGHDVAWPLGLAPGSGPWTWQSSSHAEGAGPHLGVPSVGLRGLAVGYMVPGPFRGASLHTSKVRQVR